MKIDYTAVAGGGSPLTGEKEEWAEIHFYTNDAVKIMKAINETKCLVDELSIVSVPIAKKEKV